MKLERKTIVTVAITFIVGIVIGSFFLGGNSEHEQLEGHEGDGHELVQDENGIWTCSMHPQVRQSEPGSCPFCGMDLILADNSSDENPRRFEISAEAIELANIQTTKAQSASLNGVLVLNGRIKVDERRINLQTSHFGGRIEVLYHNFVGDVVRKGEPIASIYSPELVAAQEELIEAKKLENSNPVLLQAARKKLEYWKVSDLQIKQIESSGTPFKNFDLLANYSGVITKKLVNSGDHLHEGEGLVELADLNKLWATFEVYEKDLAQVNIGQIVDFKLRNGDVFKTKIDFIDTHVNPETRIVEVRGSVNNASGRLKPDMFIEAELNLNQTTAMTIPKSAVLWTGERSVVYVKPTTELSFELREVTLGTLINDSYEVLDGLNEGEEVVTNGAFILDSEAQLQGKISMMSSQPTDEQQDDSFEEIDLPEVIDFKGETNLSFQGQLASLLEVYLRLKDDMVLGESNAIRKSGIDVLQALRLVDDQLLRDDSQLHWKALQNNMKSSLDIISQSRDRKLQRLHFINLSNALINAAESFGLNNSSALYIQYCPMANDDKGAFWLSSEENIVNPYFGDMMLTCGNVDRILE